MLIYTDFNQSWDCRIAILGNNSERFKTLSGEALRKNGYKLKGSFQFFWIGQSAEQSRDDIKDKRGL